MNRQHRPGRPGRRYRFMPAARQGVAAHLEVLFHAHGGEVAAALWDEADAALEPLPRRQALDRLALEHDLAAEEAVGAVDRAQQGRLAAPLPPISVVIVPACRRAENSRTIGLSP